MAVRVRLKDMSAYGTFVLSYSIKDRTQWCGKPTTPRESYFINPSMVCLPAVKPTDPDDHRNAVLYLRRRLYWLVGKRR